MKTLLLIIVTVTMISCSNKTKTPDFLLLNGQQLESLGIILTEQGLFYKNFNPNWESDNERYPYLGFLSNETYLSTKHFSETDTLTAENKHDSIFVKMDNTKNQHIQIL